MRPVLAALVALLSVIVSAQEAGVLRIRVVLTGADGSETPIPRAQLLISDNPATQEPRRVRTGADGAVEIKLPGGNYTVESDVPVTLGGSAYEWTQTLDVHAGRETTLTLTNANADTVAAAPAGAGRASATSGDGAVIFQRWRNSVAEIWSETAHASGFVIDARGLIATNERALGSATDVEVQFDGAVKVPGRVVATDAAKGVTIIWIDPATTAARPAIAAPCAEAAPEVTRDQKLFALVAPMFEPKSSLLGTATRVTSTSFEVDWRLDSGSAGGPVFAADGKAVGITVADESTDDRTQRRDSRIIPLSNACSVLAAAGQKLAGATPPPPTALRTEAGVPPRRIRRIGDPKAPLVQPPVIRSADFDIALLTPAMAGGDLSARNPRSFFAAWDTYVMSAPQVLLMRVTPQFEESVWKLLARGAARTQGVDLPPMPGFSANFLRMRAFCGSNEVTPIHRLIIETPIEGRRPLREGLYVFALTDFGPQCAPVRVELFSEKAPNRGESRTIDTALFAQVAKID